MEGSPDFCCLIDAEKASASHDLSYLPQIAQLDLVLILYLGLLLVNGLKYIRKADLIFSLSVTDVGLPQIFYKVFRAPSRRKMSNVSTPPIAMLENMHQGNKKHLAMMPHDWQVSCH